MRLAKVLPLCSVALVCALSLNAQNLVLGRVIGQPSLTSINQSVAPNIVEGRELSNPQSVAFDTTASPPIVYVSDTGNNRVLAWKNSSGFQNGAYADLIIGQKDAVSTNANGPNISGSSQKKGLYAPTGLLVDAQGNLYVIDSGNSRILRFPKPFATQDPFGADLVIGQPDFNSRGNNTNGISASTLALSSSQGAQRASLVFDGSGNLWVTDAGNNRVLRYPADTSNSGRVVATADVVLGQPGFTSNTASNVVNKQDGMNQPSGVSIDSLGDIYVSDALHRVLVFGPHPLSGAAATSFIGELITQQGKVLNPPNAKSLNGPQGVLVVPTTNELLVSDSSNNRVLKFPPLSQWPTQGQPAAAAVIGQADFGSNKAAVGPSSLNVPVQVAVTATEMFVADSFSSRVVVFPLTVPDSGATATRVLGQLYLDTNAVNLIEGRELDTTGLLQVGTSTFTGIGSGLAMDSRSVPHLYISDPGNNRVLGYCDARKAKQGDKADLVIGQPDLFHSSRNGDGGTTPNAQYLNLPSGLILDSSGNLYVADTGNGRVLRFAPPCDQPQGQQNFPQANLVLGQQDFVSHYTDPGPSNMYAPVGAALTPEGHLAVSDLVHSRVLLFKKPDNGDFSNGMRASTVFGQPDFYTIAAGNSNSQLNAPRGIAVDTSGRLYVADLGNSRIQVFTDIVHAGNGPASVLAVYTSDDATHGIGQPYGVYVSPDNGQVWVTPANAYRVLQYPEYLTLSTSPYIIGQVATATPPLNCIVDSRGDLLVSESGNRVSLYYPQVVPVNGASFLQSRAIAPGTIATLWAKYTSPATHASAIPLPTDLGGVQVSVSGTLAPLFYVGDSQYPGYVQVNFQVPGAASQKNVVDLQVVESSTQQVLGAGVAPMQAASPAFFMFNATSGQVAAINGDNSNDPTKFTCNGASAGPSSGCPGGTRPVKRGEVIIFYLTGQGQQSGGPGDGQASSGAAPTDPPKPQVLIGTQFVPDANVQYSGAAPGFVGLWQINVLVPSDHVAPGQANPVAVIYRDVPSTIGGSPKSTIQIQ